MEWTDAFGDINYLAILGAVISTFPVGMIWYSESLFGKTWMKLEGLKKKDVENKDNMMRAMTSSTVASVVSAVALAVLMITTNTSGWVNGMIFGAFIGLGIAASAMVTHDAFSLKSAKLTKINAAHDVVSFAVMGAIIGAFGF